MKPSTTASTAQAATEPPAAATAGTVKLDDAFVVNRLGFGAMRITGSGIWGNPADPAAVRAVLRRAVALGVNFIDTADSYGPNVSEELIAASLHPYPQGLVIATKGGLTRPGPDNWDRDARPAHLRSACEGSLQRLKVDRIDLYQLHAPDPKVPYEESIGELVRLKAEGKINCIGVSNVNVDELERAQRLTQIASVQNRYNIDDRSNEAVLRRCERDRIAFIPWFPLGAGRHAGSHGAMNRELGRIVKQHGITPSQAAIAWLLDRSPVMLPIPGTSSLAHLEENVAAARVHLS
jgi:pyridoxine 4-dehydrogenase